MSNDTDKSLRNSNAEISDDAKQTVVPSTTDNSDNVTISLTHYDGSNRNNDASLYVDNTLIAPTVGPTSSLPKAQNIYRSRENLSDIEGEEMENSGYNMENVFPNKTTYYDGREMQNGFKSGTPPPSDEELKDFLEYMEKGAANDDNIEFEVDQLRKRTASALGRHKF